MSYSVECYDEQEFKTTYQDVYNEFIAIIESKNIDISNYNFNKYLVSDENGREVTYTYTENENILLYVKFWDG